MPFVQPPIGLSVRRQLQTKSAVPDDSSLSPFVLWSKESHRATTRERERPRRVHADPGARAVLSPTSSWMIPSPTTGTPFSTDRPTRTEGHRCQARGSIPTSIPFHVTWKEPCLAISTRRKLAIDPFAHSRRSVVQEIVEPRNLCHDPWSSEGCDIHVRPRFETVYPRNGRTFFLDGPFESISTSGTKKRAQAGASTSEELADHGTFGCGSDSRDWLRILRFLRRFGSNRISRFFAKQLSSTKRDGERPGCEVRQDTFLDSDVRFSWQAHGKCIVCTST